MNVDELEKIYNQITAYEELCFNSYKQVKELGYDNTFIRGLGTTLYKYKKLKPKQLSALLDILEGG